MKLTESRIKEIILEEFENAQKEEPKLPPDVEAAVKNLPKIDNPEEYASLLKMILRYTPKGMSDSKKIELLKTLKLLIDKLLKGEKE